MTDLVFAAETLPFAVAIGLMLLIAAVEGIGFLFGFAVSGIIENFLPDFDTDVDLDVDLDVDTDLDIDGDFDAGFSTGPALDVSPEINADIGDPTPASAVPGGFFTSILAWLCVGKVPILILLVIFLTGFGLSGFVLQNFTNETFGFFLPGLLASVLALFVAVPVTRWCGLGVAKIMPKEETESVSKSEFVGAVATVIRGEARKGSPAEAKLTDRFGKTHYILLEPDLDTETFRKGDEVLVVSTDGVRFSGIANPSDALSKNI